MNIASKLAVAWLGVGSGIALNVWLMHPATDTQALVVFTSVASLIAAVGVVGLPHLMQSFSPRVRTAVQILFIVGAMVLVPPLLHQYMGFK